MRRPREPVLQDVLEGEADRHRSDAERGQHVGRLHGREHDGGHHEQPKRMTAHLTNPRAAGRGRPVAALQHVDDGALRHPGSADKENERDDGDAEVRQDPEKPSM
jgi:hypothetical protein